MNKVINVWHMLSNSWKNNVLNSFRFYKIPFDHSIQAIKFILILPDFQFSANEHKSQSQSTITINLSVTLL